MVADTSNKIRGARDGAAMLASVSALLNTGRLVRVIPGPCNPGEPGSGSDTEASMAAPSRRLEFYSMYLPQFTPLRDLWACVYRFGIFLAIYSCGTVAAPGILGGLQCDTRSDPQRLRLEALS